MSDELVVHDQSELIDEPPVQQRVNTSMLLSELWYVKAIGGELPSDTNRSYRNGVWEEIEIDRPWRRGHISEQDAQQAGIAMLIYFGRKVITEFCIVKGYSV